MDTAQDTGQLWGRTDERVVETFGACLARLMRTRSCRAGRLAEALHIGTSLVHKWKRDSRTPRLDSHYLARIAEFLGLNALEKAELEEAQLASLRAPRVRQPAAHGAGRGPRRAATQGASGQVRQLLSAQPPKVTRRGEARSGSRTKPANADSTRTGDVQLQGANQQQATRGGRPSTARAGLAHPTSHLKGGTIRGREAALRFVLDLIEHAASPAGAPAQPRNAPDNVDIFDALDQGDAWENVDNMILVTSLEPGEWTDASRADSLQRWAQLVQGTLARGWRFCHLVRLNQRAQRSIGFARLVLQLAGTGQFTMRYLHAPEFTLAPRDLVVVPGHAAVILFATQNPRAVDAALVLTQPEQIAIVQASFAQMAAPARQLVQTWMPGKWLDYDTQRLEAQERFGGRVMVKDGLSLITEPPSWSRPDSTWAKRTGYHSDVLQQLIENRIRRINSFEAHVGQSLYRDICPMKAIERLVRDGHYLANETEKQTRVATMEERIEHLEHAIALLRTHENYQLALVDDHEEADIPILPNRFWEVTGDMRVFTSIPLPDAQGYYQHAGVMIAQSTIVGAVHRYFDELWEGIEPPHREKSFVISWLERQLATLR